MQNKIKSKYMDNKAGKIIRWDQAKYGIFCKDSIGFQIISH